MLKSIACAGFVFSMMTSVFAEPKVGDACTTDQNCQLLALPGQAMLAQTLKCNVTSHKCESISPALAPLPNNDNDH